MLYSVANNAPVPWLGEPIHDVRYPLNIETLWTADELASIGLYIPLAAEPAPPGKNIVGQHVDLVDGVPKWVLELEDIPAPPDPPAPTADDVWAEKDRRWALGFDYTFSDERGTHHIGTTAKDMEDWQKVQALATAATQLGAPSTPIGIVTDTGPVTITASEWWPIVIATGLFQQPIFQAALALTQMTPIPADYATNESYWSAS